MLSMRPDGHLPGMSHSHRWQFQHPPDHISTFVSKIRVFQDRLTSPTCPVIKGLPYLFTLINTFTGWMYSQLQGTADTMAPVLLEHIIPWFGMPFSPELLGHQRWYYLSRVKGISTLSSGSLILASCLQSGHISVSFFFSQLAPVIG